MRRRMMFGAKGADERAECLNFEAIEESVTIYPLGTVPLVCSRDNVEWKKFEDGETIYEGERLYVKADSLTYGEYDGTNGGNFQMNGGKVNAYGNVLSLLDGENFATKTEITGSMYYLFSYCTNLVRPPLLPATTLADYCYSSMFDGCTSLETAPALPATTLASNCYSYMFSECTSLTSTPALPATTLANGCYAGMFYGCTSLTTAPALPATTLADYCYSEMFSGCKALTTAPALPATTLASSCYSGMFLGCTALETAPALPATTLSYSCYSDMFSGCKALETAPALPATTLAYFCYHNMFSECTSLTSTPALPATTLVNGCYSYMFRNCESIKISTTQDSEYVNEYRIPTEGTGTIASQALNYMFDSTGGTFSGTPTINTTYYTANEVIYD